MKKPFLSPNKAAAKRQKDRFFYDSETLKWLENQDKKRWAYMRGPNADYHSVSPDEITPGEPLTTHLRLQYTKRRPARIDMTGHVRIKITGSEGLISEQDEERIIKFAGVTRSKADKRKLRLMIPITIETQVTSEPYPWLMIQIIEARGYLTASEKRNIRFYRRTWYQDLPHYELAIRLRNHVIKNHGLQAAYQRHDFGFRMPPGGAFRTINYPYMYAIS